ncbi:MAG TPA: ribokinase [Bacteroidales bacterium]|nr:ribokinase [Bacteroidales bacterium]HPO65624.1 ribokinase [Bacteroidales bacterium]
MQGKIVVIGSTNIDITIRLSRLPEKGETIKGGDYYQAFGGKGANQAVAAARCGGQVSFITCLGNDHYTTLLIESFINHNIQTQYVFVEETSFTGTAVIMTDKSGENYIGVAGGANEYLTPEKIEKAHPAIADADIVLLQFEIPDSTVHYVLDTCNRLGKKVIFNMAPANSMEDQYFSMIHMAVVNEKEAEIIAGVKIHALADVEKAAQIFLKKGTHYVVITLGEKGVYVAGPNESFFIEGIKVNAVDTTGAGDVFCGALAVACTEGMPIRKAIQFANAAAALSVTRLGAQPSAPRKEEVLQLLAQQG